MILQHICCIKKGVPVSGKDVVRKLKKVGWIITSQKGSHVKLRKNNSGSSTWRKGFTQGNAKSFGKTNGRKIFMIKYQAKILKDKGSYLVEFPDLPGCFSFGKTFNKAKEMAS